MGADSGLDALEFVAARLNGIGLRAVIFTDVRTDGTLTGPNHEVCVFVCERSEAPVIASVGIGAIEHVRAVAALPVEGLIIGRALYDNQVDLKKAIRVGRRKGKKT